MGKNFRTYQPQYTEEETLTRVQQEIGMTVKQFMDIPMLRGQLIRDVTLTPTETSAFGQVETLGRIKVKVEDYTRFEDYYVQLGVGGYFAEGKGVTSVSSADWEFDIGTSNAECALNLAEFFYRWPDIFNYEIDIDDDTVIYLYGPGRLYFSIFQAPIGRVGVQLGSSKTSSTDTQAATPGYVQQAYISVSEISNWPDQVSETDHLRFGKEDDIGTLVPGRHKVASIINTNDYIELDYLPPAFMVEASDFIFLETDNSIGHSLNRSVTGVQVVRTNAPVDVWVTKSTKNSLTLRCDNKATVNLWVW
jgi:hypothetical protein